MAHTSKRVPVKDAAASGVAHNSKGALKTDIAKNNQMAQRHQRKSPTGYCTGGAVRMTLGAVKRA
jgi:hypothetical protein